MEKGYFYRCMRFDFFSVELPRNSITLELFFIPLLYDKSQYRQNVHINFWLKKTMDSWTDHFSCTSLSVIVLSFQIWNTAKGSSHPRSHVSSTPTECPYRTKGQNWWKLKKGPFSVVRDVLFFLNKYVPAVPVLGSPVAQIYCILASGSREAASRAPIRHTRRYCSKLRAVSGKVYCHRNPGSYDSTKARRPFVIHYGTPTNLRSRRSSCAITADTFGPKVVINWFAVREHGFFSSKR